MKPKLRLLWFNLVTDTDDPILGFTTAWINAAAEYCDFIDVITMRAGRLDVAENVRVYSLGKERGYSEPRRAIEFYRILRQLLATRHYDACFSHMISLFLVMGAPFLKVRRLSVTLWYAHGAIPFMIRIAERLADKVVTSTPEGFRLPSNKVQVIGQGIDTKLFVPRPEQHAVERPFTIVTVGRIAPIKRLEYIVEATKLLVADYNLDNFQMRLVGNILHHDIDYAEKLREEITAGKLEHIVEFVGPILYENMKTEYQCADVLINMSATGSADKVVLEAMSCGIPVITANEAFVPILSKWADTMLTPKDDPRTLAQRVMNLVSMSLSQRNSLGADVRQIVIEEHSLTRLTHRLLNDILGHS